MKHLSTWTRAAVALACLGLGGTVLAAETSQRVLNLVPFDIASCSPRALALTKPINEFAVQAAFRSARPSIQECLADARGFDASKGVRGKVNITLDASGAKVTASGDGLQPGARACIEKAVTGQLGTVAPLPSGAKPISFDGPFERTPATAVRMGVNEASDVEGTIRLAVPQWCSCFEDYKSTVPPSLGGQVTLIRADTLANLLKYGDRVKTPDGGVPKKLVSSALVAPPGDATGAKTASCINAKVESLPLKSTSEQFIVPVQLLLLNSYAADTATTSGGPQLQFAQLDAVREQRQAEAVAALARRQKVADDYDASVVRYQTNIKSTDAKKRKEASAMVNELKSGCAALVKADQDFTKALETQAAVEQKAVELARTLKASDASWADAEAAASGAATDTQKQIESSRQMTTANEKACPKTKS